MLYLTAKHVIVNRETTVVLKLYNKSSVVLLNMGVSVHCG